jgi:hypothetical protein
MKASTYVAISFALATLAACEGKPTVNPENQAGQIERLRKIRELLEKIDPDGTHRAEICERVVGG